MAHLLIHRGLAKKNFIENTISAFRYCFKKKYGIETDIHCTKDNKIVCFHDFITTESLIKSTHFTYWNHASGSLSAVY